MDEEVRRAARRADHQRRGRSLSATRAALGVIALLALVLALFAPVVAAGLGIAGGLALAGTWLKASIRSRGWVPWRAATPAESVVGGSGAILFFAGALVVGLYAERVYTMSGGEVTLLSLYSSDKIGGRRVHFADPATRQALKDGLKQAGVPYRTSMSDGKEYVGWSPRDDAAAEKVMQALRAPPGRSVSYSNPETQQRLKEDLAKAGIPFTTRMQDGKEFVSWPQEHNAAADKVQEELHVPRGIHFGSSATQKEFRAWLAKRGIKSAIVKRDGQEYVTWDDPAEPKAMMDAFIADRPSKCPKPKAKC